MSVDTSADIRMMSLMSRPTCQFNILIGISIDISIDIGLRVGRYSVDMSLDTSSVYWSRLSRHLNQQYIGLLLSVVYQSTGGGILFFVNLHYFDQCQPYQ